METSFQPPEKNEHIYQKSSSRELIKNQNKIREYIEFDPDLEFVPKHKEIVEALLKINKSQFLTIEGMLPNNQIDLTKIDVCQKIGKARMLPNTVNQIMSPKGKVFDQFFNQATELENKANRYNVKNKRITLNSTITKDEIDENLFAALNHKSETNRSIKDKNLSQKKTFYNKWFLPVKYWKIQKKPEKINKFSEGCFIETKRKKNKIYD